MVRRHLADRCARKVARSDSTWYDVGMRPWWPLADRVPRRTARTNGCTGDLENGRWLMVDHPLGPREPHRYLVNDVRTGRDSESPLSVPSRIKNLIGHTTPVVTPANNATPPEFAELHDNGLDWRIYRFDGCNLTLAANNTLAYGHVVELRFTDVSYISCPTEFYSPNFRLASPDELKHLQSFLDLDGQLAVMIDAESSNSMDARPFVVCADSLSLHHVTVSYVKSEGQDAK